MGPPSDYSHLVGHRFPGGQYVLPAYEAWLWADAVGAVPDPEIAHPGIAYMIGLHGGRASIGDIMALLDADPASGVLFGELTMTFEQPLVPGTTYDVEGEVLAVDRKQGRKAGVFDLVRFAHRISDAQSASPVVTVEHAWVFPRGEAA